ncbi:hypothetical protein [Streptomyces sp. NPDC005780]|uniref:hypothetical protein n=1 Tax=Streptomyces sp. NPDC005780 TaxID=3364730 RepID=UPI0036A566F1
MTRYSATMRIRPPGLIECLWYWRLGIHPPLSVGTTRDLSSEKWVRLLPQRWARIHRDYAGKHGFFWLPCLLCTCYYGGHQFGGSIPDPEYGPGSGRSVGICPRCTRAGRNVELPGEDLT